MDINKVKEVLSNISFLPSSIEVGNNWDIKSTRILDDSGVVLEKGYSIRTTYLRPEINGNEVERGYGRWMYVSENSSIDNLVKTAWLCVDILIKHELMESFLYNQHKIFDPNRLVSKLQGDVVSEVILEEVKENIVIPDTKVVVDNDAKGVSGTQMNQDIKEITDYLNKNLIKSENRGDGEVNNGIDKYIVMTNTVFHSPKDRMVRLVESSNGKIIDFREGIEYTLSKVKELLGDLVARSYMADSAEINQIIHTSGFTVGEPKDDFWIFKNPKIKHRFIVHSEIDHSLAVIDQNGDVVVNNGDVMVYEDEEYTITNLKNILKIIKK